MPLETFHSKRLLLAPLGLRPLLVAVFLGQLSSAFGAADPSTQVQRAPPGETRTGYRATGDEMQSPEQLSEYLIVAMAVVFAVPVYCLLIQRLYPHRFQNKSKVPRFTKSDIEQCCATQFVTTCPICVVCMDDVQAEEPARQLSCGHCFHAECIDSWWMHIERTNLECPTCRKTQLGPEDRQTLPLPATAPNAAPAIATARIQALYAGVLTSLQTRRAGSPRPEARATMDLERQVIEVEFDVDPELQLGDGEPGSSPLPESFAVTLLRSDSNGDSNNNGDSSNNNSNTNSDNFINNNDLGAAAEAGRVEHVLDLDSSSGGLLAASAQEDADNNNEEQDNEEGRRRQQQRQQQQQQQQQARTPDVSRDARFPWACPPNFGMGASSKVTMDEETGLAKMACPDGLGITSSSTLCPTSWASSSSLLTQSL